MKDFRGGPPLEGTKAAALGGYGITGRCVRDNYEILLQQKATILHITKLTVTTKFTKLSVRTGLGWLSFADLSSHSALFS